MTSLRHTVADTLAARQPCLHRSLPQRHSCRVRAHSSPHSHSSELESCRRQILSAGAAAAVLSLLPSNAKADGLVEFVPSAKQTPAIRAGVINVKDSYRFSHPASWKEQKIANIQSGNFCMPRCDEPWTEVVFADDSQGKAQLLVSPLRKLTNKANATIEQVAPNPTSLVGSIGPYVTGTYMDEEDVSSAEKRVVDGRTYYVYEANSLGATNGPHTITSVTTKGDLAYLFILSANDKQWSKSKSTLKKLVETFHV